MIQHSARNLRERENFIQFSRLASIGIYAYELDELQLDEELADVELLELEELCSLPSMPPKRNVSLLEVVWKL